MALALDKKRLRREIENARRAAYKARQAELKLAIKEARAARVAAIRGVQLDCRQKREELRQSCGLRRARAKEQGAAGVISAIDALGSEDRYERQIRNADRPRRLRSTSGERRQESDDEVRSNLPPDMVRVFEAVRKHIKGNARKSRTEAFLQWSEENPGEVYDLMQRDADRHLAQLLAEHERNERQLRRRSLAAVPF